MKSLKPSDSSIWQTTKRLTGHSEKFHFTDKKTDYQIILIKKNLILQLLNQLKYFNYIRASFLKRSPIITQNNYSIINNQFEFHNRHSTIHQAFVLLTKTELFLKAKNTARNSIQILLKPSTESGTQICYINQNLSCFLLTTLFQNHSFKIDALS